MAVVAAGQGGAHSSDLTQAITASDNAAALRLWSALGGGDAAAQAADAQLRAAGVDARLVDSRDSAQLDDGPRGLLVVLRDGFPDRAAAEAECARHRDVAPRCVVVGPR